MILYSIVPPEIVFNGFNGTEGPKYFNAEYKGENVLIAQMSDSHFEIARLLSTRPGSYLDPSFQPGSVVGETEFRKK